MKDGKSFRQSVQKSVLHSYSARARAIAVGTAVAGGPPHRSVREPFAHTALALSRA